jgi:hypothetical protein
MSSKHLQKDVRGRACYSGQFDYATRLEAVELAQEDKMFEEWRCVYCEREVHLQNSITALASKAEKWVKEQDFCCSINSLSDQTHLVN